MGEGARTGTWKLSVGEDCPYYRQGYTQALLIKSAISEVQIEGPGKEMYRKVDELVTCSNICEVAGNGWMPNGTYIRRQSLHNEMPVYESGTTSEGKEWCIFQGNLGALSGGHWKIDECRFPDGAGDWSQGIAWSSVPATCPGEIGNQWRYYVWGPAGSASGPVDPALRVTCH